MTFRALRRSLLALAAALASAASPRTYAAEFDLPELQNASSIANGFGRPHPHCLIRRAGFLQA